MCCERTTAHSATWTQCQLFTDYFTNEAVIKINPSKKQSGAPKRPPEKLSPCATFIMICPWSPRGDGTSHDTPKDASARRGILCYSSTLPHLSFTGLWRWLWVDDALYRPIVNHNAVRSSYKYSCLCVVYSPFRMLKALPSLFLLYPCTNARAHVSAYRHYLWYV
jgi:hypothetical protein